MRVLVFSENYLPSHRSGGTFRALAGVVARLGQEHDFRVVTRDHDDGSSERYPGVEPGRWQRVGKALVYYAGVRELAGRRLAALISSISPDVYYVNSLVSPRFGILPVALRWLGAIPWRPMILAPRGELHAAALANKALKKRAFLAVARWLPAYTDILWQAGSQAEATDIRRALGDGLRIVVARDLSALEARGPAHLASKRPGELALCWLARITPTKNLLEALRILHRVEGQVRYDIYGPVVERPYYEACVRAAATLPPNVQVRFAGELHHDRVLDVLAAHHALLLPTRGESFGHAILESLVAGCLPIISDQTPWRDLRSRGAGWDLPLTEPEAFVQVLQACVAMDDDEFSRASAAAHALGAATVDSGAAVDQTRVLLGLAAARPTGTNR